MYTINSNEPWQYLDLLNECIKILAIIGAGMAFSRLFRENEEDSAFIRIAVHFVFHVSLPCLVLQGLGITIDFYADSYIWSFIGAFVVLRFIALIVSFSWVASSKYHSGTSRGVGEVVLVWLTTTWISTIILGVPIAKAVFGNELIGVRYGVLAGISSFIFQLPLQLLFLECHKLEIESLMKRHDNTEHAQDMEEAQRTPDGGEAITSLRHWSHFLKQADVWGTVGAQMSRNPVLWAIFGGFFLSISTIGPTYLKSSSEKYVPGLGWIPESLVLMGSITTPLSLFTMGVWMASQRNKLFRLAPLSIILNMISKLVLVPLVMVGLARSPIFSLGDEAGRAAILIAALPISMASFSLGSHYHTGEALLSSNVCVGTALMLPTVLVWNLVLDGVGLYPIPAHT